MNTKLSDILYCIKMVNEFLLRNDREYAIRWNIKADKVLKEYIKHHDGQTYVRAGDVKIGTKVIWIDREWEVKNKCHSLKVDLVLLCSEEGECWISNNENVILADVHHKDPIKPTGCDKKLGELNGGDYVILPGYGAVKVAVVCLNENYVRLSNDYKYCAEDNVKCIFESHGFKFYELVD